jgi:hypothetical protein
VLPSGIIETKPASNLHNADTLKAGEKKADDALRLEQEYERSNFSRIMRRDTGKY